MLLLLLSIWAGLVVAICALCAAGGLADDGSERWYTELKRTRDSSEPTDGEAA